MKTINESHKRLLKEQYEKSVMSYVNALLDMWELDAHYGSFISDEVGGVYDYGDGIFTICMEDIIYCVENEVTEHEYEEMLEYCCKCYDYNLPTMNLNAWHKGAPRYDFTKLDAAKKSLEEEIKNEKNKF